MTIEEHISLKDFTTFKTGGNARYFARIATLEELVQAVTFAREKRIPFFVMGGGSNLLVSDKGFSGLVIKNEIRGITEIDKGDIVEISAGAGEEWDHVVQYAVSRGYYGIENLSRIPGTVGAAPVQNIGAYGSEVKDVIAEVEALDTHTMDTKHFSNEECKFSYRSSIFKKTDRSRYIIVGVLFRLLKNGTLNISYKDVREYFTMHSIEPTLENVRQAVTEIRARKLPDMSKYGTAGSFFKNPVISTQKYRELILKYPLLPSYAVSDKEVKIPLAWILDNVCEVKKLQVGDAGVYAHQALVLVNNGQATSDDIVRLENKISEKVFEKTKIVIEPEVVHVGIF